MADKKTQSGLEGFFGGLSDLVDKLADLADKGEKLSRSREFEWQKDGKNFKGICGFSIRTVLGGGRTEGGALRQYPPGRAIGRTGCPGGAGADGRCFRG